MLKRGEVDVAYLLDAPQAEEVKRDPNLKLAFSGGIGTVYLDFLDQWDPKSPWYDQRVRLAASLRHRPQGASARRRRSAPRKPNGSVVPRSFEFALPLEPHPVRPRQGQAAAGRGRLPQRLRRRRPASAGRRTRRSARRSAATSGRSASGRGSGRWSARPSTRALATKKLQGRVHVRQLRCTATRPRACRRPCRATGPTPTAAIPTSTRCTSSRRARPTRRSARRCCTRSSRLLYERVRFAPIYDYIWPSGVGPRVAEPGADADRSVPVVGAARRGELKRK